MIQFPKSPPLPPQVVSGESPLLGRKEPSPAEKDWREKAPLGPPRDKDRGGGGGVDKERGGGDKERERVEERAPPPPPPPAADQGDDFERTPSGRVRRRSAQVAVFHLQEIAEDELAKDWGTKRRIKDDLVPDSKRVSAVSTFIPHGSRDHFTLLQCESASFFSFFSAPELAFIIIIIIINQAHFIFLGANLEANCC